MKLVQVNAWLQILANIGVVAGLVFLGLQLRQNSRMMAAQTRNELTQSVITLIQMESDPRVVAAYLKRDAGTALTLCKTKVPIRELSTHPHCKAFWRPSPEQPMLSTVA